MSADSNPKDIIPGGNFMLWIDILGAPAAFLCQLQVSYMLVPWACTSGHELVPRLSWIPFFLIAATIGVLACRDWSRLCALRADDPNAARCRFMAVIGIMTSGLFALAILAQGSATFFINPCAD